MPNNMPNKKSLPKRVKSQSAAEDTTTRLDALPELVVDPADLPATAADLSQRLATLNNVFQRGASLIKVVKNADGCSILPFNARDVVNFTHAVCRPVEKKIVSGELVSKPVTLPAAVAHLYLNLHERWGVHDLNGICRAPILSEDGSIRLAEGFDHETRFWCVGIDMPPIPERPSEKQAKQALDRLRSAFLTFPFADAAITANTRIGKIVDVTQPPGIDESAFLTGLLTAVCRPSLPLAPGFIIRAPQFSGAGTGKGHLVRAIARIAYGMAPNPFTSSGDRSELDKRLTAALVGGHPLIFIDNVNAEVLRSNLLAQIVTENPCAIRPFRENTKLVQIPTSAFLAITGNALRVSEDLARRFLIVDLDAGCEDPELRSFTHEFATTVQSRRRELLAAALTIWRWGRRNEIKHGLSLGSFERWARWCRDPLVALGCTDPVRRINDVKRDDPRRVQLVEFFTLWHDLYGDRAVKIKNLDIRLRMLADPHGTGSRQSLASFVTNLTGTRAAGYVMIRNIPAGAWGTSTYAVKKTE
jgi:hypothetical protein